MVNENNSIESNNDSFVWEDFMENDDTMISGEEGFEDFGVSCNDLNWDSQTAMSAFSICFDFDEKDDVSVLDTPFDERSTDSTILSVQDWFSLDTEIELEPIAPMKQEYKSDTIEEAIRLEKRDKRRAIVMAKMLRLESSMQKLGLQLGKTNE
ncbi:unnamed protein product [Cylindrotheca closterium]|uniref:Uncharacterized protein n=1 Tax=Cylindrotheca closterium TaxID=2856 RepID=A0AAD2FSB5_9STRA|nr:unnamed protein product [Cylindrotheca closterium]